jgi:hypothetical protein
MDNKGWIKLHRKVLDNPVVCRDAEHLAVWVYLLLEATHENIDKMFAGRRTTLKPGELITGRKVISVKLNISESKVQRILKRFEIEQQIEQQTSTTSRRISIQNWNDYQEHEQEVNNNRTTSEQRVNNKFSKNEQQSEQQINNANHRISIQNTNDLKDGEQRFEQRVNNKKNVNDEKSNTLQEYKNKEYDTVEANASMSNEGRSTKQDQINYKALIDFFNSETNGIFGKVVYPISEKRKGNIRARIREYGKDVFADMIRRASKSNFLKGENKNGWKATFDWMLKPNNFQKIIEGNYDNKNQHNNGRPGPSGQNRAAQGITDNQLAEAIRRGTARALKENARRD